MEKSTVKEIKDSDKYFKVFEIEVKGETENIIVPGTSRIREELGFGALFENKKWIPIPLDKQKAQYQVKVGDKVLFHFDGMIKTTSGNDLYNIWVEVDPCK